MTNEKAREFFSSYYEGTLEAGLRQSFERKLLSDPDLKLDYQDFERTVDQLGELKFEEIMPPSDLHEIISARLDRHIYEQKRKAPAGVIGLWRNLALGGIAVAAIVGTIYSLPHSGGHVSPSTLVPTGTPGKTSASPRLTFRSGPKSVYAEITPSADRTITVSSLDTAQTLSTQIAKAGEPTMVPLENPQTAPAAFSVTLDGEEPRIVVLTGTETNKTRAGEGDVLAFAKALASFYRQPVVLNLHDQKQVVRWAFTVPNAAEAAISALASTHLTVDQRDGGLIEISEQ